MTYEVDINERVLLLGRKKRVIGFTFTMPMWMMLTDYTQLAPIDWHRMEEGSFLRKTLYCACKLWHLEKGKRLEVDEDGVEKWIEQMTTKQFRELTNTLFKSKIGGESFEDLIPKALDKLEDEKKK